MYAFVVLKYVEEIVQFDNSVLNILAVEIIEIISNN